jgi:plasmid stability protein
MATLYVENVPDDLYEGLRKRAKQNRKSIAAEVMTLLKLHVPTEEVLRKRRKAIKQLARLRKMPPLTPGPFPSAEEMIREDRER